MSLRPYDKAALSFDQQLSLLKSRGLGVGDDNFALQQLATISYYRLSGYWYPFRPVSADGERSNTFKTGASFEEAMTLYRFDSAMRLLVLDAIEHIEVAVRTQVTYQFGHVHGAFGHTEAKNFHPKFDHAVWLRKLEQEIERAQDNFIVHYRNTYTGFPSLPVWMTTEVMSLGSLSYFCKGLNTVDRRVVADFFNLPAKALQDWMHTFTYIRNVSAHHSRLWNRNFAIRPGRMKDRAWQQPTTPRFNRIFFVLLMLRHMQVACKKHSEWVEQVTQLIKPIAQTPEYRVAMGMPEDWEQHPLWGQ